MTPGVRASGQLPWWFGIPFALGGLAVLAFGIVLLLDELRFGSDGEAGAPEPAGDRKLTEDELRALDARLGQAGPPAGERSGTTPGG